LTDLTGRHPSTTGILRHFDFQHLPIPLADVSVLFHDLAHHLVRTLSDGPQLTTALRKLLEAKDCAVRARLDETRTQVDTPG
jgi:hypothetical protein